eukprot:8859838-Lingulodinium_polyedra.AAC.1
MSGGGPSSSLSGSSWAVTSAAPGLGIQTSRRPRVPSVRNAQPVRGCTPTWLEPAGRPRRGGRPFR